MGLFDMFGGGDFNQRAQKLLDKFNTEKAGIERDLDSAKNADLRGKERTIDRVEARVRYYRDESTEILKKWHKTGGVASGTALSYDVTQKLAKLEQQLGIYEQRLAQLRTSLEQEVFTEFESRQP